MKNISIVLQTKFWFQHLSNLEKNYHNIYQKFVLCCFLDEKHSDHVWNLKAHPSLQLEVLFDYHKSKY